MGNALDTVVPIASAVLGSVLLPGLGTGIGAAIGGGLGAGGVNYSKTHNIGNALTAGGLGAAGSYVGGNIGSSLLPNAGTIGGTLLGQSASDGITSALGSGAGNLLGTGIGQAAGNYAGSQIAGGFAPQGPAKQAGNYPFLAQQAPAAAAPKSLNSMSSLTPQQQASGLATQGLYGGGLGPQEQSYYANLLNRQLVNPSGGVSQLNSLPSVEQSYNNKLFGNQTDSNSLLKELSTWNPSA